MKTAGKAPAEFSAEATEVLDALSRDLLRLDQQHGKEPDPSLLNGIFRAAHSLKGLASMFGQAELAQLAHCAEDLLDRLRLGKAELNGEVLEGLGQSVDLLQQLVSEGASGKVKPESKGQADRLGGRLSKLGNAQERSFDLLLEALELGPRVREVLTEYEEHRLRENLRLGRKIFSLRLDLPVETFDGRLLALQEKLRAQGEVVSVLPGANDRPSHLSFELLCAGKDEAKLREFLTAEGGENVSLSQVSRKPRSARKIRPLALEPTPTPGLALPLRTGSGAFSHPLVQSVRVDIRRLDRLWGAVDRLDDLQTDLQQLAEAALAGKAPLTLPRAGVELQQLVRRMGERLGELHQRILDARRVPLAPLFEKVSRSLRRLAAEDKKEIYLQVLGGELEVDKQVVDGLGDALMHLVRNAVAHGIELPVQRKALGKPRRGRLVISAEGVGEEVVLEVKDDGAGISLARIREVAAERGVLTPIEVLALPESELLQLLFLPGFSTARSVSSLSGRGVGLDAVKHDVEALGGSIQIATDEGRGSCFTLTVPRLVHDLSLEEGE